MIEIKSITKYYDKNVPPALDNVELYLKPGSVNALFGENGAGKSTLIRIIASILYPTLGECLVDGVSTQKNPFKTKMKIGLLLGADTGLYPRLTVYENIKYHADLFNVRKERFEDAMEYFSEIFGMKSYLDKRASQLSFGMSQKTAIARAFIHDPEVILLDEPTTGLDIASAVTMYDFIEKCKEKGKTIIFSSHRSAEISKLADRLIVLKNGRVEFNDSPSVIEKNDIDKFLCSYIG